MFYVKATYFTHHFGLELFLGDKTKCSLIEPIELNFNDRQKHPSHLKFNNQASVKM